MSAKKVKSLSTIRKINNKFHKPNSVFHVQNENENIISKEILYQARKSGKLNLSNKRLVIWPEEILLLSEIHSATHEVDLEGKTDSNCKWWELEPLKYLDLSCNTLQSIPKEINQLDSLTTLLLHHNLLNFLPPELGQLKNLVKLDLAHNQINNFPKELTNLKELKNLNLSNNLFKNFPETIYDLVMLVDLDLSRNNIDKVNPGIGFLTKLVNLNLSENKISSIPEDFSNCRALKNINLSRNNIAYEGLPMLFDMHNLETIQLQYNQLIHIPKLKGCSNLKEIHLGFNKIEKLIPDDQDEEITVEELSTLSHLQIINLRNNVLKSIPKELSCLANLIRLDLSNNELKELPAILGLLPHLQNLLVEGNSLRTIRRDIILGGTTRLLKHLKQLIPSEELEKNSNLLFQCTTTREFPDRYAMKCSRALSLPSKELCNIPSEVFEEALAVSCNMVDLSKNKLSEVPSGIWLLSKTLNDLNLSHNQLKNIPQEIGTCQNLRYLNVANNQLESLPEKLKECVRLRELILSFNRFQCIPKCIYHLHALEVLTTNDNKILNLEAEELQKLKFLTHFDLSNNSLTSVPPLIGKMTQLRSLNLQGNELRALRPAIIAKGTEAILVWLRNKITES